MAQFNQVTFVGRCGKDPDMSYTTNGKAVTKFSIAVDKGKNAQGEKVQPMWLNVVCWNELAERANTFTRKGAEVLVQGRLDIRSYTDKTGVDRTAVDIVASTIQVFGPKPQSSDTHGVVDDLGELDDHPF